jgi:hypothetical protein
MTLKITKHSGEFPAAPRRGRETSEETKLLLQTLEQISGTGEAMEVSAKDEADRDRLVRKLRTLGTQNKLSVAIRTTGSTGVVFRVPGAVKPRKTAAKTAAPVKRATTAKK